MDMIQPFSPIGNHDYKISSTEGNQNVNPYNNNSISKPSSGKLSNRTTGNDKDVNKSLEFWGNAY